MIGSVVGVSVAKDHTGLLTHCEFQDFAPHYIIQIRLIEEISYLTDKLESKKTV